MAVPVIRQISTFDAAKDYVVTIDWTGTISETRLVIYETKTNVLMYDASQTTTTGTHTIQANTLTNGGKYYMMAYITDAYGAESGSSVSTFFACFASPTFSMLGVPETISSQSLTVRASYTQTQGRELMSWQFYLYDSGQKLLSYSNAIHSGDMSYTYKGLENHTSYYVECKGTTVDNMQISTGKYPVTVSIENDGNYVLLEAENEPLRGRVKYTAKVINILPCTEGVELDDGYADARTTELAYCNGFEINGDFLLKTRLIGGQNRSNNTPLVIISDADYDDSINISMVKNANGFTSFVLTVTVDGVSSIGNTDYYDIPNLASTMMALARIGNAYSLYLIDLSVYEIGGELATEATELIHTEAGDQIATCVVDYIDAPIVTVTASGAPAYTYLSVNNAEYDYLYVTRNAEENPVVPPPSNWDNDTILYANYDNSLSASNLDFVAENIDYILIKRRDAEDDSKWITIYVKPINESGDLSFVGYDYNVAAQKSYYYALVPISDGSVENSYFIINRPVDVMFDGVFISEIDAVYGTMVNTICDVTRNAPSAIAELINNKYGKYTSNTIANYDTGTCTGDFVRMEDECTSSGTYFEILGGYPYRKEFVDFLTDRKPKILKYETGAIWLVNIIGAPTNSASNQYLPDVRTLSFEWAETGDYMSEKDLYYAGLSDVPPEWWSNN